jgi:hypothetical protein
MMNPVAPRVQIHLDLVLSEPVSGILHGPDGHESAFSGWLELNAMIERLCSHARERALERDRAPGSR